jgi:drug/metabolite transporter (DMT)-like permease
MSLARRVRLKTYVMIALMILFGASGDVMLGKGMRESGGFSLGSPASIFDGLRRGFQNDMVWLGMSSLIVFFICYMLVLSWADYSFVSPASASSYAVVTFLSWFALGESVPSVRWVGVAVICLGVFLVSRTPTRTTQEN